MRHCELAAISAAFWVYFFVSPLLADVVTLYQGENCTQETLFFCKRLVQVSDRQLQESACLYNTS